MNWKKVVLVLMVVYSLMAVIAVVGIISIADANNTEDWLVIELEEKICVGLEGDWLWIPGCNLACNLCAGEDNETLEQSDNVTEKEEYYPWKASDFEDKGNLLHIDYFIREPKAAVAVIAFVKMAINKECVKDVLVYHNVSFGLDERAEEYYVAILQVHNETGFNENEYPPCGLTIEQAKEVFYIDTDKQAKIWLSSNNNRNIGRLYYYILLGIYHNICSENTEFVSAIKLMKNAEENTSNIEINPVAYQLAAIAYFHNRTVIERCILYNEDLPTDEIKEVERILLEKADESEILPTPSPTPRYKYDYWENI